MSTMKHGCKATAQFYSTLGWPKVEFKEDDKYPFRSVAYWHIGNYTSDIELHHQIGTFHDAFSEINYFLSKHKKQLVPTRHKERADITISFHQDQIDMSHPLETFPEGVLAYALPGNVYVNDGIYWSFIKNDEKNHKDLKYTLIHEILHCLGIGHTTATGDIMEARYNIDNKITTDTIKAIDKLYGQILQPFQALKKKVKLDKLNYVALIIAIIIVLYIILKA